MRGTEEHVESDILATYVASALPPAAAWSVEAHVTACQTCRDRLGDLTGPEMAEVERALAVAWSETVWQLDRPRRSTERILERIGVSDHVARLLAATPSLTGSWLLAVTLVLLFAVAASWAGSGPGNGPSAASLLFLLVAPLVPLAGVAAAFGPVVDPTYELSVAAPLSTGRLLFIRAVPVLTVSLALAAVTSLLLPTLGWAMVAWILPALALSAVAMALSTTLEPVLASSGVAAVWIATVLGSELRSEAALAAFGRGGQVTAGVALIAALIVLTARRRRFDAEVLP